MSYAKFVIDKNMQNTLRFRIIVSLVNSFSMETIEEISFTINLHY